MFGAVIAKGLDYRDTFQLFQPGFDLAKARQQRADAGKPEWFGEDDLYLDARPSLAQLQDDGLWVGIAGNQTVRAGGILRELDLPADMIATSDDWGVSKPDPGFFRQMLEVSPGGRGEILYVGDRLDNDIRPAAGLGLRTALTRRPATWDQRRSGARRPFPRSIAGTRTVAFPREIVPELRWHLECFGQAEKNGGLVFVGPLGGRLRRSNFRRFWHKAREAVGLPELHFHDLRHTGNTMAAAQGASLRELMERMGHSSTRAALIHLHAIRERDEAIAAGMGKLLSDARKTGRRPNRSGTQRARGRKHVS